MRDSVEQKLQPIVREPEYTKCVEAIESAGTRTGLHREESRHGLVQSTWPAG
jgi:hypothetical protein